LLRCRLAVPRLDALLAHNLGLSRKQVVRLLRAGRVRDDGGARLDDPRLRITPSELPRTVTLDDRPVCLHERYDLMQHKPLGVVTALRDARHPTAYALLDDAPLHRDLRAVGRLDKETSGLLLWTTDGTLLHRMTHPRYAVPRQYHAALPHPWQDPPGDLVLDDGHRPRIEALQPLPPDEVHPGLRRPEEATVFATITVTTGRFHEVRRIFAALGTQVLALCRVRYGPVALPEELTAGAWQATDLHALFRGMHPSVPLG
jgi:16S rRNA pseudouridine516 synthase